MPYPRRQAIGIQLGNVQQAEPEKEKYYVELG